MKTPKIDKYGYWMLFIIMFFLMGVSQQCQSQTKQDVRSYLNDIGCKHVDIVLAQARHETGNFTSYSCRVRHNLFGLRYNHKYMVFDNWKQSCDKYMTSIQYKYESGDYYEFLEQIGYATDTLYIYKLKQY